jgi:hypothetical protein
VVREARMDSLEKMLLSAASTADRALIYGN